MMLKVAIIGSCVSRLAFRSDFVPECKPFFDVVQYQFHSSIISIMSCPVKYDYSKFNGVDDEYAKEHLVSELEKDGLNNLVSSNPDILLIDFYPDVHFGFAHLQNSKITDKCWRFKRIEAFNELLVGERVSALSSFDKYFAVWKESFDRFMRFMDKYLPGTKIIVVGARFVHGKRSVDGDIVAIDLEYDVDVRNRVWDSLDSYATGAYGLEFLDLAKGYWATESHIHGLDPVHYEKSYYSDLILKLYSSVYDVVAGDLKDLSLSDSLKNFDKVRSASRSLDGVSGDWNFLDDKRLNIWNQSGDSLFNISNGEISIDSQGWSSPKYHQLHSLPIEVGAGRSPYARFKLAFDVFIDNVEDLQEDSIFLCRMHKSKFTLWHKDAISSKALRAKQFGLRGGAWEHVEHTFLAEGRFLRIGPYLTQNGCVKWRNIVLNRV